MPLTCRFHRRPSLNRRRAYAAAVAANRRRCRRRRCRRPRCHPTACAELDFDSRQANTGACRSVARQMFTVGYRASRVTKAWPELRCQSQAVA
jgi:hypothetical protein